jgi:SAM-dependent methyltransferase
MRRIARWLHRHVARLQARTPEATYTRFMRNRPQLATIADLAAVAAGIGRPWRIAVMGCSTGAELYSILHAVRLRCPGLALAAVGVDISPQVIEQAASGVYRADDRELGDLSQSEQSALLVPDGERLRVREELVSGVRWIADDACNEALRRELGPQDLVVANNFLVHLDDPTAERCVRNIVAMLPPGGHITLWGMNLDLRERLAREYGWTPVVARIEAIHDADARAREVWPWRYWGLEPLDRTRHDWQRRYATIFQVPGAPAALT